MQPLLEIKNLSLFLSSEQGLSPLVQDLNFKIYPKQSFVLLGETGSGKTLTALSIIRLLTSDLVLGKTSQILLDGSDLLSLSEVQMQKVRGNFIAMVFQDPMTSFNPVFTIGRQIEETLKRHKGYRGKKLRLETFRLLEIVQLEDAERVYHAYPHQLSGGMKQRAMIAMAISARPKLLILDEPTSALDVTTQVEILNLLKQLQAEFGMSILFITHDLAVATKMADEIAIMKQGEILEQGKVLDILHSATQPYSQKLLSALPTLQKPPVPDESETLLSVQDLNIRFPIKKGFFHRTVGFVEAVKEVSFSLQAGETLAIVGESGSGKTSLARGILSLIKPTSGSIQFLGNSLLQLNPKQLRKTREELQMIFQDPFSAMDPRFRVKEIIEEGMLALGVGSDSAEREERIDFVLQQVGLLPLHKKRYPHQLSGGQRQRVCIARAIVLGPRLLVCDEPTSSLDRSIQAQIIDLFIQLQQEYEISYLFITHHFAIVKAMAHRVIVMKEGEIVEVGSVEKVLNSPEHPYTKTLLEAASL